MIKAQNNADLVSRINENWGTLTGLINRIENTEVKEGALKLCEDLHDRFAVCPASTRTDYVGCFPGGLVWHSLAVTKAIKGFRTSLELEKVVHPDSVIILGLFHDIGKLGNNKYDYYISQTSDWHRNKGMLYELNTDLAPMPVSTRSLWWLNQYGIPLSENEIHAISSLNAKPNEAMSFVPSLNDPWEAFLLQSAVRAACIKNHGIHSL